MDRASAALPPQTVPLEDLNAVATATRQNFDRRPRTCGELFVERLGLLNPYRLLRLLRRRDNARHPYPGRMKLITIQECDGELGINFSCKRKWSYLLVVFLVQISMNFNTSLYSNGIGGIAEEFHVSDKWARAGAAFFLIMYAFGCEIWAAPSEELGRWPVLQMSLLLVNLFQLPVVLAPNFACLMVGRSLGGLSTAGGSITLGMVADMWDKEDHQRPVAFVVFSSVAGSVIGPIVGGYLEGHANWKWCIWVQLIFGAFVQLLHFSLVPETRTPIRMDKIAQRRRKEALRKDGTKLNLWGPNEVTPFKQRFSRREICLTMSRPFKMLLTERIVFLLSLLSGFSDALIFMFIQSFGLVYKQWNFSPGKIGLAFFAFLIGYLLTWAFWLVCIKYNRSLRRRKPNNERAQFESRLAGLLWTAPWLCIGLLAFALTSEKLPGWEYGWSPSLVSAMFVGVANYAVYMATIDYMVTAYGPYAASATGGNGWARDFLAGVLTVPSPMMYQNLGIRKAGLLLFGVSVPLVAFIYYTYFHGPTMRAKSPFAQQLGQARSEGVSIDAAFIPSGGYGSAAGSRRQSMDIVELGNTQATSSSDSSPKGGERPIDMAANNTGLPQSRRPSLVVEENEDQAGSDGNNNANDNPRRDSPVGASNATLSSPSPDQAGEDTTISATVIPAQTTVHFIGPVDSNEQQQV